ncbi:hypothetical protein NL108_005497, partial [Boleophthalmus pectinirostris]
YFVFCMLFFSDNLWMDQNLQSDPELPSGWRTITDSTGTYYWHLPTGATQWEHPRESAARGRGQGLQVRHMNRDKIFIFILVIFLDVLRKFWTGVLFCFQVFSVRSLGWMQVLEEDLGPGRSSIAVSHVIQQLDMKLVLKKDSLILLDPLDHTPLHCQPISSIRVWGVGCNNGSAVVLFCTFRDFAFVAGDKDSCVLKCHVFRCDVPAKSIATALHQLCSKMMSEESCRPSRSLTLESISPQDFPRQVECVEAVQQQVQKFPVKYVGNLPVSTAMGMEVVNRAIESLMTSDPDDWDHAHIHVSHSALALWRGEELLWDLPVRFLTFLGVGQDSHTFAVIVDKFSGRASDSFIMDRGTGRASDSFCSSGRFQCHVFYCDPHAGDVSEAVQAACMVQYQRCLVAQTPRLRPKVKRAASVDATATTLYHLRGNGSGSALSSSLSNMSGAGVSVSGVRRVMAFFDTLRNKPTAT